ncbi:TPA: PBECR4 domain-containing protein [Streptococcus suis]
METLFSEAIRTCYSLENSVYDFEFSDEVISLKFETKNFYHLLGFQYLENLNRYTESGKSKSIVDKALLFKNLKKQVLYGDIRQNNYYKKISTSRQFYDLKGRLELARELTYFLDTLISKNSYWKYTNQFGVRTHIKWDYLIEFQPHMENPKRYYLFIRKDESSDYYVPISLFKTDQLNHDKEYSFKQTRKIIKSVTKKCDVVQR